MFTGIVKGLGKIVAVTDREKFREIVVDVADLVPSPMVGASVAIDGTCLTITKVDGLRLAFDVMEESLKKTTIGALKTGDRVCVEPSMKAGDEIGGHFVLGHVDGVGEIVEKVDDGENTRISFRVPTLIVKYLVPKGSITIDGISLTVCDPREDFFDVWLLPLTRERTTLGAKQPGDRVNIEADYLLKAMVNSRGSC